MSRKYENAFFAFGLIVLAIMVSQLSFAEVWQGLQHAGYWFFAVVILWAFLYLFNASAWWLIIRSQNGDSKEVGFWWIYKLTVSGFALNYAPPGGLMGSERRRRSSSMR